MARTPRCNNCKAFVPSGSFTSPRCDLGNEIVRTEVKHSALGDYEIYSPKCGRCKKPRTNAEWLSLMEEKRT